VKESHPEIRFGKIGVLLINLGTPDSTSWLDIRKYLKEFLSDKRVIEVNPFLWQIILNLFILTFRPSKTAHAYKKIKSREFEVNIILDKLNEYLCIHIENQINAGADVVQIFDSWAGLLSKEDLPNYCYIPNLKIVEYCKSKKIPVICFPRGIKENYKEFNNVVKSDGLNLDYEIDPEWAKKNLKDVILQGGLDPKTLFLTNEELKKCTTKYLSLFKETPYIFNLGHGLLPQTDPDKLTNLIKFYREYS